MEAGNGATGNGNEQAGEDGLVLQTRLLTPAAQAIPQFRNGRPLDKQAHHKSQCHEQQRNGKNGINLADELIYGQQGGHQIVGEDDTHPKHDGATAAVSGNVSQDESRAVHEHRSHQQQEDDGEYQHHLFGTVTQILAHQFREAHSSVAHRKHTAHIIVHGAGKDAAQNNPQVAGRAKLGAHDGAENGTGSGNVQELNHEHLPVGHGNVIHPIRLHNGRCLAGRIRAEGMIYEGSVKEIAQNQGYDADKKGNHYSKKLK